MNNIDITVCTPTYNRGYLLNRPYNSLINQTNLNFIWLIIDDGSNDNTKEIVQSFMEQAPFKIEYYYKENGGRHTALNYSYSKITTKYVINLDSDDELLPDCINDLYHIWNNIPKNDYDRFWLVSGRCCNNINEEMIGKKWPENINKLKGKEQRKKINKIKGEKVNCRKTDILKKYPFPTYDGIKFVTENTVWEKINKQYDQYCVNNIFQKYYVDSQDGICNGGMHSNTIQRKSQLYYSIFCMNELFDEVFFNPNVRKAIINVSRCSILSNTSFVYSLNQINGLIPKIAVIIFSPIGYILTKFYRGKKR